MAPIAGYPFVAISAMALAGALGGRGAFWLAWGYGSLCSAIFLVRTLKRVVFQEAKGYGHDVTTTNYLLLAIAAFQFPFALYMAPR